MLKKKTSLHGVRQSSFSMSSVIDKICPIKTVVVEAIEEEKIFTMPYTFSLGSFFWLSQQLQRL